MFFVQKNTMVSHSKRTFCDLQGRLFFKTFICCSKEKGFEICSRLYKLSFWFPLNRNTTSMSKKLELCLCISLLFFLDSVCQRNGSPSNIAPFSRANPCFCIQYTALHVWHMSRQASKLICLGNIRFLILLSHSRPCFHD